MINCRVSSHLTLPMQKMFTYLLMLLLLSTPSNQQNQQRATGDQQSSSASSAEKVNFYEAARKLLLEGDIDTIARSADNFIKTVPYFRASIPMRIYECIREFSMLRCTKLYVLQKMEERKNFANSGNVTKDFLDQFFGQEEQMNSLISGKLADISEKELNQRLVLNFQRFFKNRDIKLHFLPDIMVKIVPSKENKLKFALKKRNKSQRTTFTGRSKNADDSTNADDTDAVVDAKHPGGNGGGGGGGGLRKKMKNKKSSYKNTIIQMAVPVMVMPAILIGTFLPFLLPVLKMATFMSMMMNNSAFIAALIYAARTHANSQDDMPQHINYGHQGYH